MKKPIVIPSESCLLSTLNCIMNRECSCVKLNVLEGFFSDIVSLAGKQYPYDGKQLIGDIAKIVNKGKTTEEACYRYIIIVEFIRKQFGPKTESGTAKQISDFSLQLKEVEHFIAVMDELISFKK